MKKIFLFIAILFWSCANKSQIKQDIDNVLSAPIRLPTEYTAMYQTNDDIVQNDFGSELKILIYTDSASCASCKISKMTLWKPFMDFSNNYNNKLKLIFIFTSNNSQRIWKELDVFQFEYPYIIDTLGEFELLNPHLPKNKALHTFLLDKNNNVILVGDPIYNEKMYYEEVEKRLK